MVHVTHGPLYVRRGSRRSLNSGLVDGLQNQYGRFTGQNNLLHLPGLETRIVQLVSPSLPATLSRCQSQTNVLFLAVLYTI
jgi:hypothetical protein